MNRTDNKLFQLSRRNTAKLARTQSTTEPYSAVDTTQARSKSKAAQRLQLQNGFPTARHPRAARHPAKTNRRIGTNFHSNKLPNRTATLATMTQVSAL